jgi:hypothetical protein
MVQQGRRTCHGVAAGQVHSGVQRQLGVVLQRCAHSRELPQRVAARPDCADDGSACQAPPAPGRGEGPGWHRDGGGPRPPLELPSQRSSCSGVSCAISSGIGHIAWCRMAWLRQTSRQRRDRRQSSRHPSGEGRRSRRVRLPGTPARADLGRGRRTSRQRAPRGPSRCPWAGTQPASRACPARCA